MHWLFDWFTTPARKQPRRRPRLARRFEQLEAREVFSADPLPVLMVLADQQDFYYREYSETKAAIEAKGLSVVVAATTTNTTLPHAGSGQGSASGAVLPNLALSTVNPHHYSAIAFVGGWGSSMYQYAHNDPNGDGILDNYYANPAYNGDAATKAVVNGLINEFLAEDKQVAAICHGVTVLAWARVDGVSPLAGKHVAVPTTVMAPDQFYGGVWRTGGYYSGQYDQVVANGGLASPVSGSIGVAGTAADDVVVDGRIITAENFDSSTMFGRTIAEQVLASQPHEEPPVAMVGGDLVVRGTAADDTIYLWSGGAARTVYAWLNGVKSGPFTLPVGGRVVAYGGEGNDRIYATDLRVAAAIYGEGGHDQITGGSVGDLLDGGEGVDRLWGGPGDDLIRGGNGKDFLLGREGNDVLLGGAGDDYLEGLDGRDILIGGTGSDNLRGGSGEDLLIGGTTSYDAHDALLADLRIAWLAPTPLATRIALLSGGDGSVRLVSGQTVLEDSASDVLVGGAQADWYFSQAGDLLYAWDASDRVQ